MHAYTVLFDWVYKLIYVVQAAFQLYFLNFIFYSVQVADLNTFQYSLQSSHATFLSLLTVCLLPFLSLSLSLFP